MYHVPLIHGRSVAHGEAPVGRQAVGTDRTHIATQEATAATVSRPVPVGASRRIDWDTLRLAHGYCMGVAAPGDGLRLRNDLLAAPLRMAAVGNMGQDAPGASRKAPRGRPDRLVTGHRGQFVRTSCFWGALTGPNPTDRSKPGSKHHILTDAQGTPLSSTVTGANTHDVTQLIPLVDAIPPIKGKRGRPRCRPRRVQADRAYDSEPHRRELRKRNIQPVLAKRNTEHGSGLGVHRWVVERTHSWLHQNRRLRVRYERRPDIHHAFLTIGCCLICWSALLWSFC